MLREISDWGEVGSGTAASSYLSVVDVQVDVMERLGVPRDRITILNRANSTAQEADIAARHRRARKTSRKSSSSPRSNTRAARGW